MYAEIIIKKKRTSQSGLKQAEPKKRGRKPKNQSVLSEVETADMELTELQKESMKEMLSIKSGELLDNVLNK